MGLCSVCCKIETLPNSKISVKNPTKFLVSLQRCLLMLWGRHQVSNYYRITCWWLHVVMPQTLGKRQATFPPPPNSRLTVVISTKLSQHGLPLPPRGSLAADAASGPHAGQCLARPAPFASGVCARTHKILRGNSFFPFELILFHEKVTIQSQNTVKQMRFPKPREAEAALV